MNISRSCSTFERHIPHRSDFAVDTPTEFISGLEQSDCDVLNQCHRMQSLSRCLKKGRSGSHPERNIGASDKTGNGESSSHIVTGDLLLRLCQLIPELASLAAAQNPGNFCKFFFLSLLLDVLKAFVATKISAGVSCTAEAQQIAHIPFDDISALVIQVLRNSDSDCDIRWLQSRTCCLKVFDIIRYLTAEEFLSKLKCDTAVVLVLSECCKVILHATEYINAKMEQTADLVLEKMISFICDDIDTGMRIDIITLQLSILNQAMKYESVFSSKLASTATAEDHQTSDSHLPGTTRINSTSSSGSQQIGVGSDTCDRCLGNMRSQITLLAQSVIGLIKSMSSYKVLKELCVNDKDLISALLDSSEIELRLQVSFSSDLPSREDVNDTAKPDRSESDNSGYHPVIHAAGCVRRCRGGGVCPEEKRDYHIECAANCCRITQNSHTTRQTLGAFYTNAHQDLKDISFDSLSSFLLFLSLINFDASLFCDYLASPETQALKYLLRISKRFLDLQNSMDTSITMHLGRIRMRRKWSHRVRGRGRGCGYRNEEFVDICSKSSTLLLESRITARNEGEEESDNSSTLEHCRSRNSPSDSAMRDPERVVVAWVKSEKVMVIEDDVDTASGVMEAEGACNNSKSISARGESLRAGDGNDDDVIQSVHPLEWQRHEDERKRRRKRNNKRDRDRDDDNSYMQNKCRFICPTDSHSYKLYDCSVKFFVALSDLLIKLAKSTRREISLPFKPAMLVDRISRIINILEH